VFGTQLGKKSFTVNIMVASLIFVVDREECPGGNYYLY
jgi:hypothetical protein